MINGQIHHILGNLEIVDICLLICLGCITHNYFSPSPMGKCFPHLTRFYLLLLLGGGGVVYYRNPDMILLWSLVSSWINKQTNKHHLKVTWNSSHTRTYSFMKLKLKCRSSSKKTFHLASYQLHDSTMILLLLGWYFWITLPGGGGQTLGGLGLGGL